MDHGIKTYFTTMCGKIYLFDFISPMLLTSEFGCVALFSTYNAFSLWVESFSYYKIDFWNKVTHLT